MYKVLINYTDRTEHIGNIAHSTDKDTVGTSISFDSSYPIKEGDIVSLLEDNIEVIRAITTNTSENKNYYSITSQDYAFYLNKNEVIIQFNKVSAKKAISELLNKFQILFSIDDSLTTLITKIYKDQSLLDVLNDILKQCEEETGIKYRMEVRVNRLYIEPVSNLEIDPIVNFKGKSIKSFALIGDDYSINKTIEDLKNKVVVVSDEEKSTRIAATKEDSNSIKKFGLLQEVVALEDKNIAQANNIANNTLADKNVVKKEFSITILGNSSIKAGRIVNLNTDIAKGKYIIKSASHSIIDALYDKVNVTLEVI